MKARMRLDGCEYAIKASMSRFRGQMDRERMLREVFALAHLCTVEETAHIVRYHQAWIDDERLHIQMELCEKSLEQALIDGPALTHTEIFSFTRQMALALEILHRNNLVHLDIKPGNIFMKHGKYKLGDFGLVSKANTGGEVQEGDSRYMSRELLELDDRRDLTKCDIFSLGCTVYQICINEPLPANGDEWLAIRAGTLKPMPMVPANL